MDKQYSLLQAKIGDEVYFELEHEENIFKGTVVEGFINIFEPNESKYFVENIKPVLKNGDIIDLIGVKEVREINTTTKLNKIKIKAENFMNIKDSDINIVNGILQFHYAYLSDLKLFKVEGINESFCNDRILTKVKINSLKELNYSEKRNSINFKTTDINGTIEPNTNVYFFKNDKICIGSVYKVYANLSDLKITQNLLYPVLIDGKKNLTYYIKIEDEDELFVTKQIFKSKSELVKLISSLPKLN